jgi:hypothetical protein
VAGSRSRIDFQKRVERTGRWLTAKDVAGHFVNAAVEEIAPRAQFVAERGDAVLRPLERTDSAELDDRGDVAGGVEQQLFRAIPDRSVANRHIAETEARHRVRLAEGVERNRALAYPGSDAILTCSPSNTTSS